MKLDYTCSHGVGREKPALTIFSSEYKNLAKVLPVMPILNKIILWKISKLIFTNEERLQGGGTAVLATQAAMHFFS
jgi:hypothetical protein